MMADPLKLNITTYIDLIRECDGPLAAMVDAQMELEAVLEEHVPVVATSPLGFDIKGGTGIPGFLLERIEEAVNAAAGELGIARSLLIALERLDTTHRDCFTREERVAYERDQRERRHPEM